MRIIRNNSNKQAAAASSRSGGERGGGWPGLIRATAEGDFADASSTLGGSLILQVRSTTPGYSGFKISLATPEKWPKDKDYGCSGAFGPFGNKGCYKASF